MSLTPSAPTVPRWINRLVIWLLALTFSSTHEPHYYAVDLYRATKWASLYNPCAD